MRNIVLVVVMLLSLNLKAQTQKYAKLDVCSRLTDSELREKLTLSEFGGLSDLHKEDDKNGGIKFRLSGADNLVAGSKKIVNTFKSTMGADTYRDVMSLLNLYDSPQQFFEMTKTKIYNVNADRTKANMRVEIRVLPQISKIPYKPQYNSRYTLDCRQINTTNGLAKLACASIKGNQNDRNNDKFLVDNLRLVIENTGSTSNCESNVKISYQTIINKKDFKLLFDHITRSMIPSVGSLPSVITNLINPNKMSDDMLNPYFKKLYINWAN